MDQYFALYLFITFDTDAERDLKKKTPRTKTRIICHADTNHDRVANKRNNKRLSDRGCGRYRSPGVERGWCENEESVTSINRNSGAIPPCFLIDYQQMPIEISDKGGELPVRVVSG